MSLCFIGETSQIQSTTYIYSCVYRGLYFITNKKFFANAFRKNGRTSRSSERMESLFQRQTETLMPSIWERLREPVDVARQRYRSGRHNSTVFIPLVSLFFAYLVFDTFTSRVPNAKADFFWYSPIFVPMVAGGYFLSKSNNTQRLPAMRVGANITKGSTSVSIVDL